ncbi:MAG: UDP-N-acetylmuramoyl-tripeptide--D-alanyl-D-alanine ligase [Bdellovibrionaceae bacterium]|nr:UDP-N-acetylmuramoyl-tripeptide--D-alanyl-D-alanine ligase [Pseudobdellovibrionaceae bacterium]
MSDLSLDFILKATGGKLLSEKAKSFRGVGTDSRADLSGQIFVALAGENFDGHGFLAAAVEKGASALLVHDESKVGALGDRATVIRVPDTLKALQAMGRAVRLQSKALVIGLTGSNGKTTTKEFIAATLAPFKKVHASKGSFNNHWGVPFTLLQLEPEKEVAVIEMGMNHAGEITELVSIAEPDVVLCTMVGRAHVEHFGSIEKIAAAKEEIYETAKPEAIRIYNLDNPWTKKMFEKASQRFPRSRLLTFSSVEAGADVLLRIARLGMREMVIEGQIAGEVGRVEVQVFGAQNLVNLMAAAAAGLAAGLKPAQIWQGLAECRTAWGRNQFVRLKSGAEMIFDAYNANPDSMAALLDNMKLLESKGKKIGVFGQMLELGETSPQLHEELARHAGVAGFDQLFFIGADEKSFRQGLEGVGYKGELHTGRDYSDSLGKTLAGSLKPDDIVVVKGSRGTKLERFVEPCEPLDFGKK